jgi:hypothetical protein
MVDNIAHRVSWMAREAAQNASDHTAADCHTELTYKAMLLLSPAQPVVHVVHQQAASSISATVTCVQQKEYLKTDSWTVV